MGKETEEELMPILQGNESNVKSFLKAIIICCAVMVLYMCGLISYVPLASQLVRQRVAKSYYNNSNVSESSEDFCHRNKSDQNVEIATKIQQEAADLLLYYTLPASVLSVFVNLVLGSYSDFLGRRFLFALPTLGATLKGVIFCLIAALHWPLDWFYLANILEGLTGGFSAFLLAVFSYTADVTKPGRKRTLMIATMEGVMAVAGSLGQLGLGYVIQDLSYFYAGICVTALFALGFLLLVTLLPETVTSNVEKHWSPIPHIKKVFGFFFTRGSCKERTYYIVAMLIFYFGIISSLGRTSVETLYQLDKPFCWSPVKIGYYGAIRLSVTVVCSLIGLKILQPCFRDMTIALIGMLFGMASFLVEGLAVNDLMLYLVPVIGFISFNAVPVARSTMSKMTSPLEQGALFSSIATMETICSTMSNSLYNAVYEGTVGVFRGAVFIMMAGFGVLTAVFIVIFLYITKDGVPVYEIVVSPPTPINSHGDIAESVKRQRSSDMVE